MRRNLDATESQVEEQSEIYFIEISSNVYLVKKSNNDFYYEGEYLTGKDVVFALNEDYKIGIKSLARDLISNFQVHLSY